MHVLQMRLGVVLAGGRSSRFGSDKALAELNGRTLVSIATDRLRGWCEHVVLAGREYGPAPAIPDWPEPGMGPLGGLAAALHHACDHGYAEVLSCSVDCLDLPEDLPALLSPAPSYLAQQPVIGLWPASAATVIDAILTGEGRHSMRRLAEALGARQVETGWEAGNINTPADLERYRS